MRVQKPIEGESTVCSSDDSPRTKKQRVATSCETPHDRTRSIEDEISPNVVTDTSRSRHADSEEPDQSKASTPPLPRRLFSREASVTPESKESNDESKRSSKRRLFGREVDIIHVPPNVKAVYKIIKQRTGSIGGNGSSGPIYGELTMGSMQKMVNLMKIHTQLDASSLFLDVGSGIGKPNFHVAQDPGVQFSCGIEVELDRWALGMCCLSSVLSAVEKQQNQQKEPLSDQSTMNGRCMFVHGNIMNATTFDPFTHVYMFSIGFPPTLWSRLAAMWNISRSDSLICYHSPREIIDCYGFDVDLITQTPTSMHGSKEGHSGYLYRRRTGQARGAIKTGKISPIFAKSRKLVDSGLTTLREEVDHQLSTHWTKPHGGRSTRSRAKRCGVVHSIPPT